MSLSPEERALVVRMQFEKSDKFMQEAVKVAEMEMWDFVANRIYYSVFHAVAGLFIHDGEDVRTHKGTVATFGQKYVLTGLFNTEQGRLFAKLQSLREKCDYNLVYSSTAEEMKPLIEQSRLLIDRIKELASK